MKKLNEQGFHLTLILIILTIAGVIFAGVFVYNRSQEKKPTEVQVKNLEQEEQKTETKSTIPEGYSEYQNLTLGIKLTYPTAWGEVKTYRDDNAGILLEFKNGIRLSASPKSVCPQGDGAPLSHFQGWYEKNGKYILNWCKYSDEKSTDEYGVGEGSDKMEKLNENTILTYSLNYDDPWDMDSPKPKKISSVVATSNVSNTNYTGFALYWTWDSTGETINQQNLQEFKKVAESIKPI